MLLTTAIAIIHQAASDYSEFLETQQEAYETNENQRLIDSIDEAYNVVKEHMHFMGKVLP